MTIIDGHGAAHDTGTGRYTSRGYRDGDSILTAVRHPAVDDIESVILDRFPNAAEAYFADSAPGTGTQKNRLDMVFDADGNVLWDYMLLDNNRSDAAKKADQAMLYPTWRNTYDLTEAGELDTALPVTDEKLRRNYSTWRNPRVLTLSPRPKPAASFSLDLIDVDEDYFAYLDAKKAAAKKPWWQRALRC
jgi:hypothetical protein